MKKLVFIFAMLTFLPFAACAENVFNETDAFRIAQAVKPGRGSDTGACSFGTLSNFGPGQTELAKGCDKNRVSCDTSTGKCSVCKSGYYLANNTCSICPANATRYVPTTSLLSASINITNRPINASAFARVSAASAAPVRRHKTTAAVVFKKHIISNKTPPVRGRFIF